MVGDASDTAKLRSKSRIIQALPRGWQATETDLEIVLPTGLSGGCFWCFSFDLSREIVTVVRGRSNDNFAKRVTKSIPG
jgi:hypothetical protein